MQIYRRGGPGLKAHFLLFVLAALGPWGCRNASQEPRPAPEFELSTPRGNLLRLRDMRGSLVLIDFWATWCLPCHESMPSFQKLYEKYKDQGLMVVGINIDTNPKPVSPFLKRLSITYPIALDTQNSVMQSYQVYGIPSLFLIDRKGYIQAHWTGYSSELDRSVEEEIKNLLNARV
ncbi:MAG: TlpA family protein disulfide reductase [Elusimicrobia bacterium]|nr:TlpA family protein disulfide reductase [Elusimicrobiota bacterium]